MAGCPGLAGLLLGPGRGRRDGGGDEDGRVGDGPYARSPGTVGSRLRGRDRVAGGQGGRGGGLRHGLAWLLLGPGRGRRDDVVGVG